MKGYIYTMFKGADPAAGWTLTDPIFTKKPTLGACMPNIRRLVEVGDHIFTISGRVEGVQQYVVGGFEVERKIDALLAHETFPENRQRKLPDGSLRGNIIVDAQGHHLDTDYHSNFERRLENYIIGTNPIVIDAEKEVETARAETNQVLAEILRLPRKEKVSQTVGRWRRLDSDQISQLRNWLEQVKAGSKLKANAKHI